MTPPKPATMPTPATNDEWNRTQATVTDFNRRVWGSAEMTQTLAAMDSARLQLLSGNGWGCIALQGAREDLEKAVQLIKTMEAWNNGPTA